MKCTIALCSEGASVDHATNQLTIFNVIEEIVSQTFPIAIPKFTLIFLVERDGDARDEVGAALVLRVNGEEMARQPFNFQFQEKKRMRLILTLGGVVIPAPGQLESCLFLGDELISSWKIDVTKAASVESQVSVL